MKYSIVVNPINGAMTIVAVSDDVIMSIPFDESNSDYQQYLIDTDGGLPLPKESK